MSELTGSLSPNDDLSLARKTLEALKQERREVEAEVEKAERALVECRRKRETGSTFSKEEITERLVQAIQAEERRSEELKIKQAAVEAERHSLKRLTEQYEKLSSESPATFSNSEGPLTAQALVQKTQKEVDLLKEAVKAQHISIARAEEAQDELASEIDRLHHELAAISQNLVHLRDECKVKTEKLATLTVDKDQMDALEARRASAREYSTEATKQALDAQNQLTSLQSEVDKVERNMDDAGRAAGWKDEIAQITQQLQEIRQETQETKQENERNEVELVRCLEQSEPDPSTSDTPDFVAIEDAEMQAAIQNIDAPASFKQSLRFDRGSGLVVLVEHHYNAFVQRVMEQLKSIENAVAGASATIDEKNAAIKQEKIKQQKLQEQIDVFQREQEVHPSATPSLFSEARSAVGSGMMRSLQGRVKPRISAALQLKQRSEKLCREILDLQLEQFSHIQDLLQEELQSFS